MTTLQQVYSPNFHLSFEELFLSANVSAETMLELIEHEIAVPVTGEHPRQWMFHVTSVMTVKKAARLNRDLNIDWADLYLVLNLLDEIEQIKAENHRLKQRLNRKI